MSSQNPKLQGLKPEGPPWPLTNEWCTSTPGDSRQFLSSLMSPQSLSKSHHQMLLIQLPLLQRYWLRRQVFSKVGEEGEPALFLPPDHKTFSSQFPFLFPQLHSAADGMERGREGPSAHSCTGGRKHTRVHAHLTSGASLFPL